VTEADLKLALDTIFVDTLQFFLQEIGDNSFSGDTIYKIKSKLMGTNEHIGGNY
jgi:hypothetical protein